MTDPRPVNRIFGPYQCTYLFGGSSNSSVYRARHTKTGTEVALRIMNIDSKSEEKLADCLEELTSIQKVKNPYLIPIEDFGSENNVLYIAMRLMQGASLESRFQQRTNKDGLVPSLGETTHLLRRIANALDTIHEMGVVHAQIAPRNILFDEAGEAYLADTGMTRLFKLLFSLHTTSSFSTGNYSSPEQWSGERPGPSSDIYSLGCVVYQLVTGQLPFMAPSIFALMQMHLNDMPDLPHRIREGVPGSLTMIIIRALAKQPEARYQTAREFYEAFARAIEGHEGSPTDFFAGQKK